MTGQQDEVITKRSVHELEASSETEREIDLQSRTDSGTLASQSPDALINIAKHVGEFSVCVRVYRHNVKVHSVQFLERKCSICFK